MTFTNTPSAVILAAGLGRRLGARSRGPKCLIDVFGRTVLDRQLDLLRSRGIDDVTCVIGPTALGIADRDVRIIINERAESTNMVASLFCAREVMERGRDVIVTYGDIVYEPVVLDTLLSADAAVSVVVDRGWRALWAARMGDPLLDAETLRVGPEGELVELGRVPETLDEIEGQYVGLVRFDAGALPRILNLFDALDRSALYEGRSFDEMYMTTFLQILIDQGLGVRPAWINHGWLEIDTPRDLDVYGELARAGTLAELYDPAT